MPLQRSTPTPFTPFTVFSPVSVAFSVRLWLYTGVLPLSEVVRLQCLRPRSATTPCLRCVGPQQPANPAATSWRGFRVRACRGALSGVDVAFHSPYTAGYFPLECFCLMAPSYVGSCSSELPVCLFLLLVVAFLCCSLNF